MNEYEQTGVLNIKDLSLPSDKQLNKGVAITECIQKIPCNPCVDSCPFHAITIMPFQIFASKISKISATKLTLCSRHPSGLRYSSQLPLALNAPEIFRFHNMSKCIAFQ